MDDNETSKTVFLARKDLDVRTLTNAIGHAALAMGWRRPAGMVVSPSLVDADGGEHAGVSAWPFIVLVTRQSKLVRAVEQARATDELEVVEFLEPMLTTTTDDQLVAEVAATCGDDLNLLGVLAHGPRPVVDDVFGGFSLLP